MQSNMENKPLIGMYTIIGTTGIGVFMSVIDSSVVNISLHRIVEYFKITLEIGQWVILAYLLAISAFMIIAGDFGDRYGNKKIFQIGMLLFSTASLLCSLSLTIEMLILFRIIQAVGASFIMANGVAIITSLIPKTERGKALGWNSLIVSSGLLVGPVLGCILTDVFGWQSIFLINVPIGIIGFLAVSKNIPTLLPNNKNGKKTDFFGAFLFSASIILFVYGMTTFSENTNNGFMKGITIIIIALALLASFIIWSKYASDPIIEISLFTNKTFTFSIISGILVYVSIQSIMVQLPYFLQEINHLTPITTSIVIFGIPLMMALTGPWAGKLSDKILPRYISTIGAAGIGFTALLLSMIIQENSNLILVFILMLILGFTIGVFSSPNANSVMSSAPKNKQGIAGGMMALARNVGFSIGLGFSTALIIFFQNQNVLKNGGLLEDPINYIPAFQMVLIFVSILSIITIIISYLRGNNYYKDQY